MKSRQLPWHRDPFIYIVTAFSVTAHALVFFAGRYLPYVDWASHVGLIGVLANGDETGAAAYFERSLAPTPYLGFYAFTALLAQLFSVEAAAKLSLLLTTALLTFGAASLAEACDRSPRLALVAPLALFGMSLGWGFGSFVFAMPWMLFSFAASERLLARLDDPSPARTRLPLMRIAALAASLAIAYLCHALIFGATAVVIAVRWIVHVLPLLRTSRWPVLKAFGPPILIAFTPTVLLTLPTAIPLIVSPWRETGSQTNPEQSLFAFRPFADHLQNMYGDLLARGPENHVLTMHLCCLLFAALLVIGIFRPSSKPQRWGLEIYAGCVLLIFLFAPNAIEWPFAVWLVYPRFGTLAALLVMLLPRIDLSGWRGALISSTAVLLVAHNAVLNRRHVERHAEYADRFTPVREQIPVGARVLALTIVPASDFAAQHPTLGALYCYLLADRAAYTAFMFDNPLHPVRYRKDVRLPRAPFWRNPGSYDPRTHGADYDYLVLRGDGLVRKTIAAGLHAQVANVDGWVVFRTKQPPPPPAARD